MKPVRQTATLHLKMPPELRARAQACAKSEGATLAEFVRDGIRARCGESERKAGQRARMLAKAET